MAFKYFDDKKKIDDVIADTHQDMLVNFLSIHDELVFIVDKHLFKPIFNKIVKMAELREVFDKLGMKYITFKFDVEYDNFGSYTASESFDVYKYDIDGSQMGDKIIYRFDSFEQFEKDVVNLKLIKDKTIVIVNDKKFVFSPEE